MGTPGRAKVVRMSQAVCLFGWPDSAAFKADCGDVSGGALVSAPLRGAVNGYDTVPFAAALWGCPCLPGLPSLLSLSSLPRRPTLPSLPCRPSLPRQVSQVFQASQLSQVSQGPHVSQLSHVPHVSQVTHTSQVVTMIHEEEEKERRGRAQIQSYSNLAFTHTLSHRGLTVFVGPVAHMDALYSQAFIVKRSLWHNIKHEMHIWGAPRSE